MDPEEAPIVLRWARHYAAKGLVPAEALAAIEADCQAAMGRPGVSRPAPSVTVSQVLHALGGALLAAAAIAAVLLLYPEPNSPGSYDEAAWQQRETLQAWTLAALGTVAAGIGAGLLLRTRNHDLADAFLVAATVCFAVMALPSDSAAKPLSIAAVVALVALPLFRQGAMVAALATLGFALASFRFVDAWFGGVFFDASRPALTVWLTLVGLHAATVLALRVARPLPWLRLAAGMEALALVAPVLAFAEEVLDPGRAWHQVGGTELMLAAVEGALLAYALVRREAPLLVTSALVIAVDAVVFAFDVGNQTSGVLTLLAVAAAVLGLGTVLRKRWLGPIPSQPS